MFQMGLQLCSKTDRFQKSFHDPPLDVVYDTDTGHKKAMTTAVAASPINYAVGTTLTCLPAPACACLCPVSVWLPARAAC